MTKRMCISCGKSITRRPGQAIYCVSCYEEKRLERARGWWKKTGYSKIIVEKRKAKRAEQKLIREAGTCKTCRGFGLWGIGDPSPMGPIDASEGFKTIACPECGASANPKRRS